MKLTESKLRNIIREELSRLNEDLRMAANIVVDDINSDFEQTGIQPKIIQKDFEKVVIQLGMHGDWTIEIKEGPSRDVRVVLKYLGDLIDTKRVTSKTDYGGISEAVFKLVSKHIV